MSNWTANNYHWYRKTINICDNISHAFVCLPYLRRRSTLWDAPAVQKSQVLTPVSYQSIIVRIHEKKDYLAKKSFTFFFSGWAWSM